MIRNEERKVGINVSVCYVKGTRTHCLGNEGKERREGSKDRNRNGMMENEGRKRKRNKCKCM